MLKNWNYQEAQRRITSGQSYKILWFYNISSGIWQLVKLVEYWFNGLEPWMGSIAETYVIPMFRCLDAVLYSVRLILILVWVSQFTHSLIWDVITYSFSSFNVEAFQIWERTSNFVVLQMGFFLTHTFVRNLSLITAEHNDVTNNRQPDFFQQRVQDNIKENIKSAHYWASVEGSPPMYMASGFSSHMASKVEITTILSKQCLNALTLSDMFLITKMSKCFTIKMCKKLLKMSYSAFIRSLL